MAGARALRALAACLALQWRGAAAWSTLGHERVARVAQDLLKGKHRDQIRTMMHGDLVDLATWERTSSAQHPETEELHWHRQEPEWTCGGTAGQVTFFAEKATAIRCDAHWVDGDSLFCALAYFFEHFAHDSLLAEFPAPAVPIQAPKVLPALAKTPPNEITPAHHLRWLVALIGDLHQPLHWLRQHSYGRDIKVLYGGEEHTLLSFWEDVIPKHLAVLPAPAALEKQYQERAPAWWDKVPPELFRGWAKEAAEVACSQVYGAMEANHADGSRRIDSPFHLDEEMFQRWLKLAQDFTIQGGQRLAYVLNDILEHKRHKAAHKEGRGRHHRRRRWLRNFGINLSVAAVVVPLMVFLLRWHERHGAPTLRGLLREHLKL